MPERRYSRYKQSDVWTHLAEVGEALNLVLVPNSVHGHSVSIHRSDIGQEVRAVILARSSDWYFYRLNCTSQFQHGIEVVVCGTHDSCIDRPVYALDAARWYEPKKMRSDFGSLDPKLDAQGKLIPDTFDQCRRSEYGHNMLMGALMQRRPEAFKRLATLRRSTRLRIEAEVKKLHRRKAGRPVEVWPVFKLEGLGQEATAK